MARAAAVAAMAVSMAVVMVSSREWVAPADRPGRVGLVGDLVPVALAVGLGPGVGLLAGPDADAPPVAAGDGLVVGGVACDVGRAGVSHVGDLSLGDGLGSVDGLADRAVVGRLPLQW